MRNIEIGKLDYVGKYDVHNVVRLRLMFKFGFAFVIISMSLFIMLKLYFSFVCFVYVGVRCMFIYIIVSELRSERANTYVEVSINEKLEYVFCFMILLSHIFGLMTHSFYFMSETNSSNSVFICERWSTVIDGKSKYVKIFRSINRAHSKCDLHSGGLSLNPSPQSGLKFTVIFSNTPATIVSTYTLRHSCLSIMSPHPTSLLHWRR